MRLVCGPLLWATLAAQVLGGCMLPAYRFATPECRAGKRREGRLALLPADITVFTSPRKRRSLKQAGLQGGVLRVVDGLRGKGHRVVASIDVGGRITAVGRGQGKRLHPEDIRNLRITLHQQAELMVDRRAAAPPYAVDGELVKVVAQASGADALLYLYVTAYSEPAKQRRASAGDVAVAVAEYLAAIGVSVAVGALVGGMSVELRRSSVSVHWSSRNLSGKRVPMPAGGPAVPGASGVVGPVLIAQTTTPLMAAVPCHSCPPAVQAPAADTAGEADPESREPTLVGETRRVESSVIEATLVAVSAQDGRLLWVSRWFHQGDIADRGTSGRLFEHIVEEFPSCGMKQWDWNNFRD
jgi:hypothetical protein